MVRHRLTDQQWELVQDLFPPPARTGRPRRDRREILDGILWILRTGAPWRDLPEELGPWATAWDLFDTWNDDGTLDAILSRLRAAGIDAGLVDRELWCVDGTVVRAARCAGGGGKGDDPEEPADHALGRSRGGFSTKIHLLCDGHGHPLDFHLTPGQAHETTGLVPLLEGAEERVVDGDGEPIAWPVALAGDKGYPGRLDRRIPAGAGDHAGDPVEGERGPCGPGGGVRPRGVPAAEHRRVPDRLAEGMPAGLLAVREDGQELRRHDQDGVHPTLSTPVLWMTVFRHSLAASNGPGTSLERLRSESVAQGWRALL